jgi:phosphinothricin acetyltransferase
MSEESIRPANDRDVERVTEIYNHYVVRTPITFDIAPFTPEQRRNSWFAQFTLDGPHRLLVAENGGGVCGYAGTHQFRNKAAYDTTIETTVYLAPDAVGRGLGGRLYTALFAAMRDHDLRLAVAGITLPNAASVALHERFGFVLTGVMHEVGRKLGRYWDVAWYEKRL